MRDASVRRTQLGRFWQIAPYGYSVAKLKGAIMDTIESFSVREFCRAHGISRAFFYKLRDRGEAPISFKIGKLRRVSLQAANRWLDQRQGKISKRIRLTPEERAAALRGVQ
jgi:predicted DNA-binding transcriptional regulator AlpA